MHKRFDLAEIVQVSQGMRDLEADEPLVCCWRYHGGTTDSGRPLWRRMARRVADLASAVQPLKRPAHGQVVFLTDGPTAATFGMLKRLMEELRRRGRPGFLVSSPKTRPLAPTCPIAGHVEIRRILAAVPAGARSTVRRRARDLAAEVRAKLNGRAGPANHWLEVAMLAREGARRWVGGAGAVVVDAEFEAIRKGFVLGARDVGVPTMMVQHGLWSTMMFPVHTDLTACWGELFRREAEEFGLSAERTQALGCPRWDDLPRLRATPPPPDARRRCGGNPGRPLVLLISGAHAAADFPEQFAAFFAGMTRLLESGLDIALRLHPADRGMGEYRGRVPNSLLGRVTVTPPDLGLHGALRVCDVAYHTHSSASLEAMQLGVPLLFERGRDQGPDACSFPNRGGGVWCRPSAVVELCQALGRPGPDRDRVIAAQDQFLADALTNSGVATAAVADVIEALAARSTVASVGHEAGLLTSD